MGDYRVQCRTIFEGSSRKIIRPAIDYGAIKTLGGVFTLAIQAPPCWLDGTRLPVVGDTDLQVFHRLSCVYTSASLTSEVMCVLAVDCHREANVLVCICVRAIALCTFKRRSCGCAYNYTAIMSLVSSHCSRFHTVRMYFYCTYHFYLKIAKLGLSCMPLTSMPDVSNACQSV